MQEPITATDLHVLADVTILANCAAVYVVAHQPNSVSQDLVTCEWQISKHSIKVPRLELISTHMGNKFSTECKVSIRKSKREINHRLDIQHTSSVLAK